LSGNQAQHERNEARQLISGDDPITNREQDVLGRAKFAEAIAAEICSINTQGGAVLGLLGPWGSGKTSLINLISAELAERGCAIVLEFNPWMFSGADQLTEMFFGELSAQLGKKGQKLKGVAQEITSYRRLLTPLKILPVVGAYTERVEEGLDAIEAVITERGGSVAEQRKRISSSLESVEKPIVVVLDDLDRLSSSEIRDIFKLVRLTASFPNVIYLLAFDRLRVEQALGDVGVSGRDYLEKILQWAFDIPAIPDLVIREQIIEAVQTTLNELGIETRLDRDRFQDTFEDVLRPFFRNMRDVRRYAASIGTTIRTVGSHVELGDLLAIEAVRIFLPDVFSAIPRNRIALTSEPLKSDMMREHETRLIVELDKMIQSAGDRGDVIRQFMRRQFPYASQRLNQGYGIDGTTNIWLKDRRIASMPILSYYLEATGNTGIQALWNAESALAAMDDPEQLGNFFADLDPAHWESTLEAFGSFQDDISYDQAQSAIPVVMNLLDSIPERPWSGILDKGTIGNVLSTIYTLCKQLGENEELESALEQIYPRINSLSSRLCLLEVVGHGERGGELVSPRYSKKLESRLREEIRNSPRQDLSRERLLVWLLTWHNESRDGNEPELDILDDSEVLREILKRSIVRTKSKGFSSRRIVEQDPRLDWKSLSKVFGDEGKILAVAETVASDDDPVLQEAVQMVRKQLRSETCQASSDSQDQTDDSSSQ